MNKTIFCSTRFSFWLSEFGIIANEGFFSTDREEEWRMVVDSYMIPVVQWLGQSNVVQKWFWYVLGEDKSWNNGLNLVTDIFKDPFGRFNTLGIVYMDLAQRSLLFNKGFEAAGTKPYRWWTWAGGPGEDYTFVLDDNEKHSGMRSVKIHVGQLPGQYGAYGSVNQNRDGADLAGQTVKLLGWCKTANGGACGMKISYTNTAGTRETNWTPSIVPQTEYSSWTKIETNFVQIPIDAVQLEMNAIATSQNGDVWFDDFDLVIGP